MDFNNIDREKLSPMMKQYWSVKDNYLDHILFFRLGDFYEMFFSDAILVSKLLELTLTGRDCGMDEKAPMCGVPYHSSETYIKKLVDLGYKVAVCEQLTDPSDSKGIVIRDVVRIVTPGTVIESSMLSEDSNNYICGAFYNGDECALCFADISTGEVNLSVKSGDNVQNEVINELSRYRPSEVIFNSGFLSLQNVTSFIKEKLNCSVTLRDDECFDVSKKEEIVLKQFSAESFDNLGIDKESSGCAVVCGLFDYIGETQKSLAGRFTSVSVFADNVFMGLDLNARRNLELTETLRNKERKGSLLWVIDDARTSMGKRLIKTWIEQPLRSPARIIERLDAVEQLVKKSVVLMELQDLLDKVYDIERLMTRIIYRTATPRDLKMLAVTAVQLPYIKEQLAKLENSSLIKSLDSRIATLEEISNLVENAIVDEPPVSVKEGGIIKDGFSDELDELRNIMTNGQSIISDIEQRERDATGIKTLKIGQHRTFGYYIEVTRSYYDLVPERYIRRQTLTNAERFVTDELKNAENAIVGAKDKSIAMEADIFAEIREFIASKIEEVQSTAESVAVLDAICSFASVSIKNMYVKPEIAIDGIINIKNGRHPVVELMLKDEEFVPNNVYLDTKDNRMHVITGPNMSGKSTFMRQNALITLMAQIGCFVPAEYAKISIVDQIFTRIGASDDLTAGQSTFMVEMSEVADIVKHATKNSLVILDEVGRGTSTFDGISIAHAVAEYIASKAIGCKTLFATHYHELTELENMLDGVKNFSVAVKRNGDNIRFLRKIVPGGADDSYGIEVAKLAGLPDRIISKAKKFLKEMEAQNKTVSINPESESGQISFMSLNNDIIADRLRKTNINELTDAECREVLMDLSSLL
ncbi:MAG: DNA mismatch repair protein MutS [Oscillospiraceae bacterium]